MPIKLVDRTPAEKKARLEDITSRIGDARLDRNRYAARINEMYALAAPDRKRMNSGDEPASPDMQDDIYDEIVQDVAEDAASDMVDVFTPKYRDWTSFSPKNTLSAGEQQEIAESLQAYSTALYSAIRNSNFYSTLADVWVDIFCAAGALCIPYPGAGSKTTAHYVPMAELLFEEGPEGIDGRWWEQKVQIRYLQRLWPDADWSAIQRKNPKPGNKKTSVTQGAVRDWSRLDEEVWQWHVIADGEIVYEADLIGEGSCPLIPTRWRRAAPSAWGLGPLSKALPPGRTLNKLAVEILTMVEKRANAPHTYEEDGVQNYEQGVDAGTFIPRMPGSKPPESLYREDGSSQVVYFEQEDLRQRVRRALFQDKPIQRGETPPTLGQWLDEKTTNNRRMENPRDRIVSEGVMPWIKRFAWIEKEAGRLPEVKLDGSVIEVSIQSPLSKASDMEDVSVASQTMQIGAAYLGDQFSLIVDGRATMARIKAKLNDKLVVLKSEEQIAQELALQAQAMAGAGGAPAG